MNRIIITRLLRTMNMNELIIEKVSKSVSLLLQWNSPFQPISVAQNSTISSHLPVILTTRDCLCNPTHIICLFKTANAFRCPVYRFIERRCVLLRLYQRSAAKITWKQWRTATDEVLRQTMKRQLSVGQTASDAFSVSFSSRILLVIPYLLELLHRHFAFLIVPYLLIL